MVLNNKQHKYYEQRFFNLFCKHSHRNKKKNCEPKSEKVNVSTTAEKIVKNIQTKQLARSEKFASEDPTKEISSNETTPDQVESSIIHTEPINESKTNLVTSEHQNLEDLQDGSETQSSVKDIILIEDADKDSTQHNLNDCVVLDNDVDPYDSTNIQSKQEAKRTDNDDIIEEISDSTCNDHNLQQIRNEEHFTTKQEDIQSNHYLEDKSQTTANIIKSVLELHELTDDKTKMEEYPEEVKDSEKQGLETPLNDGTFQYQEASTICTDVGSPETLKNQQVEFCQDNDVKVSSDKSTNDEEENDCTSPVPYHRPYFVFQCCAAIPSKETEHVAEKNLQVST